MVIGAALLLGATAGWLVREVRALPTAEEMRSEMFARYSPAVAGWEPLWAVSPKLTAAVVAWEDPAFFHHGALSWPQIAEAAAVDLASGSYVRGGSTITQQVVKNLYLNPEKTLRRKLHEAVLAHRLERILSKEQILEIYLNVAEWGDGVVGIEGAARGYFRKSAADLDWAESALLASLLPNPRAFNPCREPELAVVRRAAVLNKLLALHILTSDEFRWASRARVGVSCPDA
jgi:monofunctional biosynthetic peptidoglycan transglycosylase